MFVTHRNLPCMYNLHIMPAYIYDLTWHCRPLRRALRFARLTGRRNDLIEILPVDSFKHLYSLKLQKKYGKSKTHDRIIFFKRTHDVYHCNRLLSLILLIDRICKSWFLLMWPFTKPSRRFFVNDVSWEIFEDFCREKMSKWKRVKETFCIFIYFSLLFLTVGKIFFLNICIREIETKNYVTARWKLKV